MNEFQLKQLDRAYKHAAKKDGKCLSTEYITNQTKALWKCNNFGHEPWLATFSNVLNHDKWCPKCGTERASLQRKKLDGLKQAKEYAKSRGGECLSTEYKNVKAKLLWKCSNPEHEPWSSTFDCVVSQNRWCIKCHYENPPHNKLLNGLDLAKDFAKLKGGECLSTEYKNSESKLTWKCANTSHKPWEATFANVANHGSWCPQCSLVQGAEKRIIKGRLPIAKAHALSKNGQCLSTSYKGVDRNLTWKCSNLNHETWEASFYTVVKNGHWCPECGKKNLSEKRTRLIFERFFGKSFSSARPTWNINPWTNRTLELDGYCKEFNIAFEFDGDHHFEINVFNKKAKKKDFIYQQFKDHQKKKNCTKNGVLLVNIPIPNAKVRMKFSLFLDFIIGVSKSYGIDMTFNTSQIKQLESDFYSIL